MGMYMSFGRIPLMRSKAHAQLLSSAHNIADILPSYLFILPQIYLYHKDEWALPRKLQSKKNALSSHQNAVTLPPHSISLQT
jgi:hypothetical protein